MAGFLVCLITAAEDGGRLRAFEFHEKDTITLRHDYHRESASKLGKEEDGEEFFKYKVPFLLSHWPDIPP